MKKVKILEVEKEVLKKIDMICRFACCKYSVKQGSIISIKGSNIAYVSPHIITIKENNYLIFNGSDKIFINDYFKCIKCCICGCSKPEICLFLWGVSAGESFDSE